MAAFGFDLVGLSTATRYMRSPSAFSDVSVKPSFLRTTPAKKPRTECCCHPVAFMIAAIVVPLGCLSSPRTVTCLVPPRVELEPTFPLFAGFFVCLARATFVLLGMLRCDIFQILSGSDGTRAVTTEAPQWRYRQRGWIEDEAERATSTDNTDALFAAEVQSFLSFCSCSISALKIPAARDCRAASGKLIVSRSRKQRASGLGFDCLPVLR